MNMKAIFFTLLLVLLGSATVAQTQQQRLEKHIYYMAADSLRGRQAGSKDARKVADYIEHEFNQIGLQPLYGSHRLYFRTMLMNGVEVISEKAIDSLRYSTTIYRDVVGVIPGCDPVLKNEYIVVGGHYDHLGVKNGKVYNGADDNASGTACVIEMARQLINQHPSRTIIFCAFDAEEIGLFGSKALATKMEQMRDINKVKMMMSIDMVGWLKQGKDLRFEGTGTLKDCEKMLQQVADQVGISIRGKRFESSPITATDTEPFAKNGVPTLAVTTGLKSPYHKPEDDANLIDYPGLDKIVNYMTSVVMRMASPQETMASSGHLAAKHLDRFKTFEAGVVLGYDMSNLVIPQSIFTLESAMGLAAGISTHINFANHLGLELDAQYHYARAVYPDIANPYTNQPDIYSEHVVLVPAQIRVLLGSPTMSFNIGVGGYYGYRFSGQMDRESGIIPSSPHQYGINWSLEYRVANISMDFTWYYQLNNAVNPQSGSIIPPAQHNRFCFTLGYYF